MGLFACRSTNPDELTESDIQLLYTENQSFFIRFLEDSYYYSAGLARMTGLQGRLYADAVEGENPRSCYYLYTRFIHPEFQELLTIAKERELYFIGGSTKVLRAYIYFSMYDLFEDPGLNPISDSVIKPHAFQAAGANPEFHSEGNYLASIDYLHDAIADLNRSTTVPELDYFYQGDARKWIRLAKSLQLRAYNTIRLVNPDSKVKINELLADGEFIESLDQDFEFRYSNYANNFIPNHPEYLNGFAESGYILNTGPWLSNYFMWLVVGEKEISDPRRRYYFYRRVPHVKGLQNLIECEVDSVSGELLEPRPIHYAQIDANMPYCLIDTNGYIGQDHLTQKKDIENNSIRTTRGLYPFGGKFDDDSYDFFAKTSPVSPPELGKGVLPILHASNISFIRAEASLTLGTDDDPRQMLEEGIRKSFEKINSFDTDLDLDSRTTNCGTSPCLSIGELIDEARAEQELYINYVLKEYDNASEEERLDIVMKEYLIALWGNGLEAYNNYRRTALPANIQPAFLENPDEFVRSAPNYKLFDAHRRTPQPVFWDVLDASLFR